MTIHPGVPANTVLEFVAYAKANPGKVNYASPGFGTSSHLFGELLKQRTGIEIVHVPYRGATPAIADLLAGQVQMFIDNLRNVQSFIQAGKLRALAVTTAARLDVLPDIPTVADFVPGYEASQWFALGLRKTSPAEIVDQLNREINAILSDPKMKARLADLGTMAFPVSTAELAMFVAEETEKWGKVVKASGAKPE